ncbi:MAG: aminoglycoside phosphotransferase family protein [Vicinamibacterales bacterium]
MAIVSPTDRLDRLREWVAGVLPGPVRSLAPASEDASFRRYFRLAVEGGSVIAMDAPPEQEDCSVFVRVAGVFRDAGMHVPAIVAQATDLGFLLLSDFGSITYLDALNDRNADALYGDAVEALIALQRASRPGVLPAYDRELLARELRLFPEWFVGRHHGVRLAAGETAELERVHARILACNLAEPSVYVHRDYHSRNLMVTTPNPGVLDFQDAVYGPITYDLVSLFRDAYVEWPEERVLDWLARYWERARRAGLPVRADFGEFYRDFEWMGVQRHLKVLGIFARLHHRDGKPRYLADLPRVAGYLRGVAARYGALAPLARLLDRVEDRPAATGYTF